MSVKLKQVFSGKRLDEVHALYETAFPASEKKPFSMIVSGQGTGLVEILSLEENNRFLGLAIMAKAGDRVLLDYFAIADEVRGHGAGSAALQVRHEVESGILSILPVKDFHMELYRQVLYHKDKWHTGEMDAFIELAKETFRTSPVSDEHPQE